MASSQLGSSESIASPVDSQAREIARVFALQRQNQRRVAGTTAAQRIEKLQRLRDAILNHRQEIRDALQADFGKHASEVDLSEIYPVIGEVKYAKKRLGKWMRPQRVSVPWAQVGSKAYIHYEPKGVALIQSPWNFPINLTLGPLVGAIAAGNTAIVKPSEYTAGAAAVMEKILKSSFDEDEVALFHGGSDVASRLLEHPFDHIFFTGSTRVGKIVMTAAAKHLASVTLELGGKSPTIVDETADLGKAARRVAWAKCFNNGQICIATDHVYVHQSNCNQFIAALKKNIEYFYGSDPRQSSSYCRIVNDSQFNRVNGLLEDAIERGATVEFGGQTDAAQRYISPTVLSEVHPDSLLMQEEIFGPLLPVITYSKIDDAIKDIHSRAKPLAFYIYSRDQALVQRVIDNTSCGGTCINQSCLHFFNHNLPFGGVNHSGIGKSHGEFAFKEFSNARAVYKQSWPWSAIEMMMPPYNDAKQKLIDLTLKWF